MLEGVFLLQRKLIRSFTVISVKVELINGVHDPILC